MSLMFPHYSNYNLKVSNILFLFWDNIYLYLFIWDNIYCFLFWDIISLILSYHEGRKQAYGPQDSQCVFDPDLC